MYALFQVFPPSLRAVPTTRFLLAGASVSIGRAQFQKHPGPSALASQNVCCSYPCSAAVPGPGFFCIREQ